MPSTTGTVRSALARPPKPVVSWPRQPQASGLVDCPRGLAAHADLDQHGVGALDRRVEARRRLEPRRVACTREHPAAEAGDRREPLLVRVVQPQLVHIDQVAKPDEPVDDLRRVRRAAADDRELHGSTSAFARAICP
jgi:hypothetical protein